MLPDAEDASRLAQRPSAGERSYRIGGSDGFEAVVALQVRGCLRAARRMMERCHLSGLAESLCGVQRAINHPAIMTHASVPADRRDALGIHDNLVRLTVDVEHAADLRAELDAALSEA